MKKTIKILGLLLTMSLTGGMEAAAQYDKHEIQPSDLYVGAGYTIGSFSGVTFLVSGVCKNHDLQVSYTMGLKQTPTVYWYNAQGDVDGALKYKHNTLEMKYGYQLRPWKPLAITPQVGCAYERLTGKQQTGTYDGGNGSDAWCIGAGVKVMCKPCPYLNIFVAPEYKFPIRKNAFYEDVMGTVDKTCGGFAVHMGLLFSFQLKAKKGGSR